MSTIITAFLADDQDADQLAKILRSAIGNTDAARGPVSVSSVLVKRMPDPA